MLYSDHFKYQENFIKFWMLYGKKQFCSRI